MVGELDLLSEWIPEQMQPGTVFVLENAGEIGEKEDAAFPRRTWWRSGRHKYNARRTATGPRSVWRRALRATKPAPWSP